MSGNNTGLTIGEKVLIGAAVGAAVGSICYAGLKVADASEKVSGAFDELSDAAEGSGIKDLWKAQNELNKLERAEQKVEDLREELTKKRDKARKRLVKSIPQGELLKDAMELVQEATAMGKTAVASKKSK